MELSGTAKAAALLLAMSRPTASRLLKHFDEDEVKIIAQAANDLGSVSKDVIDGLIEAFAHDIKHGASVIATTAKIQELLEGVFTPEQIAALIAKTGASSSHAVWHKLHEIQENALTQYLQKEHPQVVALVLSRADSATSARLLKAMPRTLSQEIIERMLSLKPVSERPLALLEISFLQDLLLNGRSASDVSPHTRMAQIINKMDRRVMDECLQAIATYNDKDAELIRQQLFTFEDLSRLGTPELVTVFDAIQPDVVIRALYGVPAPLKEKILEAIPSRARRAIEVELESGPSPNMRKTLKAQRAIADIALEMIERGIIEIRNDDEDDE